MNKISLYGLVVVSIVIGTLLLSISPPEVQAVFVTLLVILAVIGVPILVGYTVIYVSVDPSPTKKYKLFHHLRDKGEYGLTWFMGITAIVFTTVIIGGTWLAIYGVYSYILNLLGG